MTSRQNNTYIFSFLEFLGFLYALICPVSEEEGICMQLKSNLAVTDTTSLETEVQHISIKPLIIQPTDGQYNNFCKKVAHIYQMNSTYITHLFTWFGLGMSRFQTFRSKERYSS